MKKFDDCKLNVILKSHFHNKEKKILYSKTPPTPSPKSCLYKTEYDMPLNLVCNSQKQEFGSGMMLDHFFYYHFIF